MKGRGRASEAVSISKEAILVKQGKPISHYRGVEPVCVHCKRVLLYGTWECKHPASKDLKEYKEPCTTLEWEVCPLKRVEGEKP